MRTVTKLAKMEGRVYVYLKDKATIQKFLSDAENEGFTFCDSIKPTARKKQSDIYAVNPNGTINFVGYVGHLASQYAGHIGNKCLIKVDYEKYYHNKSKYEIL